MFENFYDYKSPKPISLRELTQRVKGRREGMLYGGAVGIFVGFAIAYAYILLAV